MKLNKIYFVVLVCFLFASCATHKQIIYFQDAQNADSAKIALDDPEIRFQPDDKISIVVSCRDPELANLFNLPNVSRYVGAQSLSSSSSGNQGLMCYTIDPEGYIDFPELGKLQVAGMTRSEVAAFVKGQLIGRNLIQNPVVTVEYANLQVSLIGEVKSPGRYNINRDKVTILDAISMAGDLTITGNRKNVMVMRADSLGEVMTYTVDLTSIDSVKNSPVYYLCQNDMIYVEPNKKRARQADANGNTLVTPSFWISMLSALTTITSTTLLILQRVKD